MKNFEKYFRENSKIKAFLVSKMENIFYLTGFQGSFGYLLVLKSGKSFLITDSRYAEVAEKLVESKEFEFLLFDKNFKKNIQTKIPRDLQKIAMENSATLAQKSYWQALFSDTKIESTTKIIENWRSVKKNNELQKIEKACDKVNNVFDDVDFFRGILTEGKTEKEVSFELEMQLREHGIYELSFPIIVAFGKNSAIPHHSPSDRKLKKNENILIDCGVRFENYCSDITRNFFFGSPNDDYLEAFNFLLETQKKTLEEFNIGNKLSDVESFCRQELGDSAEFFTHSLGHGVGIEIHENPNFSQKRGDTFAKNQVVTCEPGLYFSEKFGIRIEDQVWITENGAEILTKTSKELIVL